MTGKEVIQTLGIGFKKFYPGDYDAQKVAETLVKTMVLLQIVDHTKEKFPEATLEDIMEPFDESIKEHNCGNPGCAIETMKRFLNNQVSAEDQKEIIELITLLLKP